MVATSAFASDSSAAEESEAEKKISCKKSSNNKKKVERKSNRYHDKTKAKAHLGACVTGGIAMGVLAGPIGLVFAAVYINAMCVTMYGGSQFVTGDKKENKKPEEELPQESTSPHPTANSDPLRPEPASQPEQDDGKGEGEADRSYYNKVNSDNFTFAPVISSGDNITINGNIYLYPGADYQPTPNADHTSKNAATQTSEQASETLVQEQDRSVFVTNITQVPSPSIEQTGPLDETVKQILVDPSANSQLFHCTFSDGMNAYLRADPHLITPTKVATHQQHIHQQQVGTPSSPPTGFLGWVKNGKNDSWIQTNQFTPVQTTEGPIRGKNYEADAGLNLSSGERSHNAPPVSLSSNQGNQDPLDDDDSTALKFTTEKVRTAELKYRNDAQLSTISSRPVEETHSVGSGNSGLSEQHSSEKPENEPELGKLPETEKHHLYKEENLVTSDRILTGLDSSATTGSLGWVKGEDNSGWKQTNQFTPVQTTEGPIRGKNYEADAGSSINSGERLHNAPSVSLSSNQGSAEPLSDDDSIELQSTTNEVKVAELISRNDTSEPLSDDDFIELQSTTNEVKMAELISRNDTSEPLSDDDFIELQSTTNEVKMAELISRNDTSEPLSDDDFIELQSTTNEVKMAELISRNDTSEPLSDDDFIELQSTTNEVKVAELISRNDTSEPLSDDDSIELQPTTNEFKVAELISRNDTSEPLSDDGFIELQQTTNEVKVAELISRSDSKGSLISSKVSSKEDIPEKKETAFLSEHILSGGWKFEVQGGKARWVNVQASNSNTQQRPVILSAGSAISGVAQNYTQGIFANVKDLDESRRESFHKLQEGVSVKQLSEFNIINGKAERPLDKQNIAYVA
ncbi:hypothetical protein OW495_05985 [Vibrio sp. 14N.309.X.WAT.E.F5]|uniref:hypothetical protein n=1 Tax=Vibrio sp. 14N.309.X.WAT.E.F5 TaxID=2998321 RepID=UPI0025B17B5A|nr:hypothetical protein [Vibrio sp. 14N.309.X.WAT.E.F5]MDN2666259.1 hypothetical protein [Vibrio sp. 14N.309.X.WAT.E.F5]